MGKQNASAPQSMGGGMFSSSKAAMQAFDAMSVMFGMSRKKARAGRGIENLHEAMPYFEELEDQLFDTDLKRREKGADWSMKLGERTADFQREQLEKNFMKHREFSRTAMESLRNDPTLKDLGFFDTKGTYDSFANQINKQLAQRGISKSGIGAAQAGIAMGSAAEGIRNNRLNMAKGFFGGGLGGLPAPQAGGSPQVQAISAPQQMMPMFGSLFNTSSQIGLANQQIKWDQSVTNAQFGQQWNHDIGAMAGVTMGQADWMNASGYGEGGAGNTIAQGGGMS